MFFPSLGQGRLLIDSACLFAVKVSIYQKVSFQLRSFKRAGLLARLSAPEGMEWMYCNESLPRIQKQIFAQLVISNMWFHYSCRRWEQATCLRETRLSPKLNWGPLRFGHIEGALLARNINIYSQSNWHSRRIKFMNKKIFRCKSTCKTFRSLLGLVKWTKTFWKLFCCRHTMK